MSELTLSLIAGAICIILAVAVAGIVQWLHLRAAAVHGSARPQARRRRAASEVLAPLLWWGIAAPLVSIGILFPTIAVANIIWKFLP